MVLLPFLGSQAVAVSIAAQNAEACQCSTWSVGLCSPSVRTFLRNNDCILYCSFHLRTPSLLAGQYRVCKCSFGNRRILICGWSTSGRWGSRTCTFIAFVLILCQGLKGTRQLLQFNFFWILSWFWPNCGLWLAIFIAWVWFPQGYVPAQGSPGRSQQGLQSCYTWAGSSSKVRFLLWLWWPAFQLGSISELVLVLSYWGLVFSPGSQGWCWHRLTSVVRSPSGWE